MRISLNTILKEIIDNIEKDVLNSRPKQDSIEKFKEITDRLMKILKNPKVINKSTLYNIDTGSNMYKPSVIAKADMEHHMGEYQGEDFKDFGLKLAGFYEKAGFKVEYGYGIDDIKGFEVTDDDGEVVGELDFLKKDSIPGYNNTVIVKYKK